MITAQRLRGIAAQCENLFLTELAEVRRHAELAHEADRAIAYRELELRAAFNEQAAKRVREFFAGIEVSDYERGQRDAGVIGEITPEQRAERDAARTLLREAGEVLEPLANKSYGWEMLPNEASCLVSLGDLRRARAFLDKLENTDG